MKAVIRTMELFGVEASVIGDVLEGARDRPSIWFWIQAASAMASAVGRDLRTHWVLALRALLMGALLSAVFNIPRQWLWYQLNARILFVLIDAGLRRYDPLASGMVGTVVSIPCTFAVAWLVCRLHRTQTPSILLIYLAFGWIFAIPETQRLAINAVTQPRFVPYLAVNLVSFACMTIATLAGGLSAQKRTLKDVGLQG